MSGYMFSLSDAIEHKVSIFLARWRVALLFLGRLPELVADVKFCVAWSANPSPSFGTRHPPYRRTCLSPFTLTTLKITSLVFQTSATTALARTVDRSILPGTREPNNTD